MTFALINITQRFTRYCNMDYIVVSGLKAYGELPEKLFKTYDIACMYGEHFEERIKLFPPHVQITLPTGGVTYAIPKYHFRAHKEKEHSQFSLHLLKGVGRVCGEQIERTWPKHSETAGSTREMGPGSRHDTLEDHFGYTNWRVFVTIGMFPRL